MGWKSFLGFMFFLVVVFLLGMYWFIPFDTYNFEVSYPRSNNSLHSINSNDLQFYENMRYSSPNITYKIQDDCTLQKKYDMEMALDIVSEDTVLNFFPTTSNEDISVSCESRTRVKEGLFIAGEGGPVNITRAGDFYVIFKGSILLIRDSSCESPNIAIHELLHVLGYDHSSNTENIMFNITNCRQEIGIDVINSINELYSTPSLPDIAFEEVSAIMQGRYLSSNLSVRNIGLSESKDAMIYIYADDKLVKEITLDKLEIGHGKIILVSNIWVNKINVQELIYIINSSVDELDKDNNKIILEVKE